ncbi:hypothetical protein GQ53DRAFT_840027 [Thozetella sp. PMI_491]|nr:hypothetical protein GQ53DRAFT_840027 [Thozetella sp. PMI_491]
MAAPMPIASYGNNSQVAQDVRAKLLPEFDIVHIAVNLEAAEAELPLVAAGELDAVPASGLGTNATLPVAERKAPKAIIFGGGIPEDEVTKVTTAVQAKAPGAKFVRVTREDFENLGLQTPNPEAIVKILKEKLSSI